MKGLHCIVFALLTTGVVVIASTALGAVTIANFEVEAGESEIAAYWETSGEIGNLGFYMWRSESHDDGYVKLPLNVPEEQFIPSEDFGIGSFYEFIDVQVTPGILYYYKVQDIPANGSAGELVGPESAMIESEIPTATPIPPTGSTISCTLQTTSTTTMDTAWNNHDFSTDIQVSNYTDLSLISSTGDPPGFPVPTQPDFYRLDNAVIGAKYSIIAKSDMTVNYNLGIRVYNKDQQAILTDTDASTYYAAVAFFPNDFGPYYIEVFQASTQCTGDTYSLIYNHTAPTPVPIHRVYLPIVVRLTRPAPLKIGQAVTFTGAWYDMPLEAVIQDSEWHSVLYDHGEPVVADGIFVIALVNATNHGLRSDEVGQYTSIKLRDVDRRVFDLASVNVHKAAEDTYGRESLYYPIQPGFTLPMVFVFDVPPETEELQLVAATP